jgi:hypothetical protein
MTTNERGRTPKASAIYLQQARAALSSPPTPAIPAALRRPVEIPLHEKPVWSVADAARATTLSARTIVKLIKAPPRMRPDSIRHQV